MSRFLPRTGLGTALRKSTGGGVPPGTVARPGKKGSAGKHRYSLVSDNRCKDGSLEEPFKIGFESEVPHAELVRKCQAKCDAKTECTAIQVKSAASEEHGDSEEAPPCGLCLGHTKGSYYAEVGRWDVYERGGTSPTAKATTTAQQEENETKTQRKEERHKERHERNKTQRNERNERNERPGTRRNELKRREGGPGPMATRSY